MERLEYNIGSEKNFTSKNAKIAKNAKNNWNLKILDWGHAQRLKY